jgi:hypothetical protein
MTPLNLSVVFAPTILRPLSIEREMSDMQAQRMAVQALLDPSSQIQVPRVLPCVLTEFLFFQKPTFFAVLPFSLAVTL